MTYRGLSFPNVLIDRRWLPLRAVDFGTGEQSGYGGDGISRRYAGITQSVGWLIRNQPIGNCIAVDCVIARQGAHSVDGEEG